MRFYESGDGTLRQAQVDEALKCFQDATGLKAIDRFVVGFDGIRWAGGDEECTSGTGDVDLLAQGGIWEVRLIAMNCNTAYRSSDQFLPIAHIFESIAADDRRVGLFKLSFDSIPVTPP